MQNDPTQSPKDSEVEVSEVEVLRPESGLFHTRDGTPIYYESVGQGKPLVLCYGLLCRREHWRHQLAYFAKRYRVVTFDYRGHQRSAVPVNDQNVTIEWCARDVQDLISYLGLEEVVCFGHSLGVPILVHAALLEPRWIKACVFVCGSVNNPFESMLFTNRMDQIFTAYSAMYERAPVLLSQLWKKFTVRNPLTFFLTAQLGFNPSVAQERDILSYMEGIQGSPVSVFHSLLKDYRSTDRRALLPQVQQPILVIAGEDDCITPMPTQEEMVRLLPLGELERVPQGSHNAHMDYPESVNHCITEFLKRLEF